MPSGIRRALRLPSSAARLAHELDDEMRFHLDQRVAELMDRGMTENDARAEALRRFGDSDDLRDYCQAIEVSQMRRMRFQEWWESWTQDVRFSVRQIARAPGFFAIAAITLALGIAATTSIFSVVSGVLLKPLPYPEPERIVELWQMHNGAQNNISDPNFDDIKAQSRSFSALAVFNVTATISVSGLADPVRVQGASVSREFFNVFKVAPLRGRLFDAAELRENGAHAVLISSAFWRRNFGGADSAIGHPLQFDGQAFTVVGVLPPNLDFPTGTELWIARELQAENPHRTAHNWEAVGRLASGVSVEQAKRDVSSVARRLKQQYGADTWMDDADVVPLQDEIVGSTRTTILVLMAGSLLLLFIACANVVNLLIARMAARSSEMALRAALGAGRGRIVQQLLAESLVLSLAAGAFGVLLARVGVRALLALQPGNLPRMGDVRLDWHVLAFAVAVAVGVAVAMGLIAAWRGSRGDLRDALAQSQRTQGGSLSSERVRQSLVVAQLAMAVVLLVATGLFIRSFMQLLSVDPGFRERRQVVVDVAVDMTFNKDSMRVQLYDELLARLRAIPGVTEAGGVSGLPLTGDGGADGTYLVMNDPSEKITMEDFARLFKDPTRTGMAEYRIASPGYFAAMGIPLVRGRFLDDRDTPTSPHAAVVSASFATKQWPNEDPIGKTVQYGNMDGDLHPFTIVGVVGDVRERSLAKEPRPTLYASYRQRPRHAWRFNFVLATPGDPASVMSAARRVVRDVRPDLPPRVRTIESIVSGSIADRRFVLLLVGVFGAVALSLAGLGVYSVISYLVAQRARELSIRVALGARGEDIVRLVVRQGLTLGVVGTVVGAAAALAATRVIASMLWGVSPTDATAFMAVIAILGIVAAVASWVPARRAAKTQAMDVLRVG